MNIFTSGPLSIGVEMRAMRADGGAWRAKSSQGTTMHGAIGAGNGSSLRHYPAKGEKKKKRRGETKKRGFGKRIARGPPGRGAGDPGGLMDDFAWLARGAPVPSRPMGGQPWSGKSGPEIAAWYRPSAKGKKRAGATPGDSPVPLCQGSCYAHTPSPSPSSAARSGCLG